MRIRPMFNPTNFFRLLSLLCLLTIFFSCTSPRYIHGPTALSIPYFQQKGDAKIGGFYSDNGSGTDTAYVHGYDLTGAYALTSHVALTASYHRRREQDYYRGYRNDPFDTSLVRYKRWSWEAGGGYILPLDSRKAANLSFYSGVGLGNVSINEAGRENGSNYSRFLQVQPFKFYLQPCFYFMTPAFRFAMAYRINWIWYNNLQSDYSTSEAQTFRLNQLTDRTMSFAEAAFDIQLRYPKLPWAALEGQMSFTGSSVHYYTRNFNVSGGLVIDPVLLFKAL